MASAEVVSQACAMLFIFPVPAGQTYNDPGSLCSRLSEAFVVGEVCVKDSMGQPVTSYSSLPKSGTLLGSCTTHALSNLRLGVAELFGL